MSHFMFYAGIAYNYKLQKEQATKDNRNFGSSTWEATYANSQLSKMDPVNEAVKQGFHQELSDIFFAKHSAYSYEDLPTDLIGATFGAEIFDPNSSLTLSEQIEKYLNELGATDPQNAPNYNNLPTKGGDTPSRTNHTTNPVYTNSNP